MVFETIFVSVCQFRPGNSVEGKCGQSKEAYAGFCYLLNILDGHRPWKSFKRIYLCMKLHLVSFSSFVGNLLSVDHY